MALRVKCRCGKQLQVSSKLADRKISCTSCGWAFSIPKSRFEAAPKTGQKGAAAVPSGTQGAASAPQRQPSGVTLPSAAPPPISPLESLDTEPVHLDLDSAIADLSGTLPEIPIADSPTDELRLADDPPMHLELAADGPAISAPDSAPDDPSTAGEPTALNYARDRVERVIPSRSSRTDAISGPVRGFWPDALMSLAYPVRTGGNIITFAIVCIISLFMIPLGMIGCYGLIPILIIFGWKASLYLSVVQETATGSEDLPGIKMEDGFLGDVIIPALKYIGAFAVAVFPAAAYLILMATGVLPDFMVSGVALLAWVAIGLFLWPVFVMLFAFNALDMLIRIDLIFTTIFRTFGAYASIWLMLLLVGITWVLPLVAVAVMAANINVTLPDLDPGSGIAIEAVMNVLDVYLTIVSMRLIGLYYLHFKRRFTLVFE